MRCLSALLLLSALYAAPICARFLGEGHTIDIDFYTEQPQAEAIVVVDNSLEGNMQISGLTQDITVDTTISQLLERPKTSYLDLSWTNWVEQRMEMVDILQEILNPPPRCPHMQQDRGSLDIGMVSYLASSRFGPAILTTYTEKFQEDSEDDFDYEEVFIPERESFGKSYEDASLLEDLSADIDKAFQEAEQDRMLSQQSGFFGANLKSGTDQMIYLTQLDGELESLQTGVNRVAALPASKWDQSGIPHAAQDGVDYGEMDAQRIAGLAIFLLLCTGCIYVWMSLLLSCCKMGRELRASRNRKKADALMAAQTELLAPLMPEEAEHKSNVEYASSHVPQGLYYAPQGDKYVTVAVPLINGEFK